MATGLKNRGWATTLIRARTSSPAAIAAAREFPGRLVETPFPAGPWPALLDRKGLRYLYRRCARLVGRGRTLDDPAWGWARGVATDRFMASLSGAPDAVLGVTFGGLNSLWAAKVFAERVDRPLFLDFRDPCPGPGGALNAWEQACLDECMAVCAAAITTTASYASMLAQRYPNCAEKIVAIHTAYEDEEVIPLRTSPPGCIELLHAGALYGKGKRTAEALLHALKKTLEEHRVGRDKVRFRLLGGWVGAKEAKVQAERLGLADVVEIQDAVPYAESLRVMEGADVLVVIKFVGSNSKDQIPGKLMHYLGRKKPILGIMGRCEAGELIERSGMGRVYGHEDIEGIASFIARYAMHPEALSQDFRPNVAFVSQFSLTALATKLDAILRKGMSDHKRAVPGQ